ncbi:MAG: hypothetical protein AB7H97_20620 [Pseudobdellovibrionaceae bacterium]
MRHEAVAGKALAIGELFLMLRATTPTLDESKLAEVSLYGRRTTPQEVGDCFRREVLHDVFLVEKPLI